VKRGRRKGAICPGGRLVKLLATPILRRILLNGCNQFPAVDFERKGGVADRRYTKVDVYGGDYPSMPRGIFRMLISVAGAMINSGVTVKTAGRHYVTILPQRSWVLRVQGIGRHGYREQDPLSVLTKGTQTLSRIQTGGERATHSIRKTHAVDKAGTRLAALGMEKAYSRALCSVA